MKKYKNYLVLAICLLYLPFIVDAKEYCKVISGNGKDIGSEIACGTEHFYIIDSNADTLKLFAKYNLYTGAIIYREKIEQEPDDKRTPEMYCSDLASSKGGIIRNDDFYQIGEYCYYQVDVTTEHVIQKEEAKSAHWDEEENYLYPQVGDVYGPPRTMKNQRQIGDTRFYDFDIDLTQSDDSDNSYGPSSFSNNLVNYKRYLEESGFTINQIDLISLSEIDETIQKISGKSIPLKQWGDEEAEAVPREIVFGNLKSYIPEQYKWLYSTTYWNRTLHHMSPSGTNSIDNTSYIVFVSALGKIFGSRFIPDIRLGYGIRPVIIIPNNLKYLIKTETDGNGTIEVIDSSLGGENITFKVSTNKGYKLGSIIIKTDSGEEVEFKEEDITKNENETISISSNIFTMPYENVTIQARWQPTTNPKTRNNILLVIVSTIIVILGLYNYKELKKIGNSES